MNSPILYIASSFFVSVLYFKLLFEALYKAVLGHHSDRDTEHHDQTPYEFIGTLIIMLKHPMLTIALTPQKKLTLLISRDQT